MCVKSEDNKLGLNFENAERLLSKGVKVTKVLECGDDVNKSEIKKIWLNEMAKAWKDKVLSGQFVHGILENSDQIVQCGSGLGRIWRSKLKLCCVISRSRP